MPEVHLLHRFDATAVVAGEIDKHVYKHETCRRCPAPVESFDLPRGRSAYRCTRCQPAT